MTRQHSSLRMGEYGNALQSMPMDWHTVRPKTLLVLGSKWDVLLRSKRLKRIATLGQREVLFSDITGLRAPDPATGHKGAFELYELDGMPLLVMNGRLHYYDTEDLVISSIPLWIALQLGVTQVLLTSAVGGLNPTYEVGDLVAVKEHASAQLDAGFGVPVEAFGPKFLGNSGTYSVRLREKFIAEMDRAGLRWHEGQLYYVTGRSYESPAENRMYRLWGNDIVGVSGYPEATLARNAGCEVFGVSCVTNKSAMEEGLPPPNHDEVAEAVERAAVNFTAPLFDFIESAMRMTA